MNIKIVPSTAVSASNSNRSIWLPDSFPILVDSSTSRIIEPTLLYLHSRRNAARNTLIAAANDLKDWWIFLSEFKLQWNDVVESDITEYRDIMFQTYSPKTHQRYSPQTVRRRLTTVLDFYKFATRKGKFARPLDIQVPTGRFQSQSTDALAHLHIPHERFRSSVLPRKKGADDQNVNPIQPKNWRLIADQLGPFPSAASKHFPSRDRLVWETALNSGMRIHEVLALTKWQIAVLTPDLENPTSICVLPITVTKGSCPRKVFLPSWLAQELQNYIDGERKSVIRRTISPKGKEPSALFVNGAFSRNRDMWHKPLQTYTCIRRFSSAVIKAGLVKQVLKHDPETGEEYTQLIPLHTGHDTRHTFAIWTYHARKQAGDNEPWKIIQTLLGHKQLSTTTNIYLRIVDLFEARTSDTMLNHFRQIAETTIDVI